MLRLRSRCTECRSATVRLWANPVGVAPSTGANREPTCPTVPLPRLRRSCSRPERESRGAQSVRAASARICWGSGYGGERQPNLDMSRNSRLSSLPLMILRSGSDTGSHALLNRAHASSCTAPLVTDGRTASADYCTDGIAEHQERSSTAAQPRTASRGLRRGALGILPSLEYHETGTKGDAPPDGMCATQ